MKEIVPIGALAQHIIVLGATRSGKSTAVRVIAEDLLDRDKPVCIIDPKGDWWGIKSSRDGKKAGYPLVIFGGEHADVPITEHSGPAVAELIATGNRSCLIDLSAFMVGERTRFFVGFASHLFKLARGARHLIIDEVHNFAPQGRVMDVDAGKMLHWSNRLASEGLGRGIAIIAASQRPQKVHKDFVTSCETLIAKKVIHKLDRDAIKDWIDGCADPAKGKEVIASLAQLKKPQAWIWCPEIEYGPALVEFPLFKTFDSFRPREENAAPICGWAEVDLDAVKAKLAKVVEQARANDPVILRKRIAELESAAKTAAGPALNPAAVEELRQRAFDEGFAKGAATVRAAADEFIEKLKNRYRLGQDFIFDGVASEFAQAAMMATVKEDNGAKFDDVGRTIFDHVGRKLARATSLSDYSPGSGPKSSSIRGKRVKGGSYLLTEKQEKAVVDRVRSSKPGNGAAVPMGELSTAAQRIIDYLGWLESLSLYPAPKETLAAVCGVSPTSGAYFKNLGALRAAGFIEYPQPSTVAFTDIGRKFCRGFIDNNGKSIAEHWLAIVTPAQRAILQELINAHPSGYDKDSLARMVKVSPSSGAYFKNLGKLRTLGAIDYPSPGVVSLTRYVMP